jgi:enoyl-CoA hydratase
MPYTNLLLDITENIATVTINRPAKLNALDRETFLAIESCFTDLAADPEVYAVILTGAGQKAFVVGADISNIAGLDAAGGQEWSQLGQRAFNVIEKMPKPVIAAINGFALGGGLELAMACHLRVAADTAQLGQPEVKIGWIPGNGGSQRLPRLIGKGRALELMLTGDPIIATEAERIGLVNLVVPAGDLADATTELAARIAANSRSAVSRVLEAVHHGLNMSFDDALAYEAALGGLTAASPDAKEGTAAFLEKRPPKFEE